MVESYPFSCSLSTHTQYNLKECLMATQQFNVVDWNALEKCLTHLPRVQQSSYCKLLLGILNTNAKTTNSMVNQTSAPVGYLRGTTYTKINFI